MGCCYCKQSIQIVTVEDSNLFKGVNEEVQGLETPEKDPEDLKDAKENDIRLATLLTSLRDASSWPQKQEYFPNSTLLEEMEKLFRQVTVELSWLAKYGKIQAADQVAAHFHELIRSWGESVLEVLRIKIFIREEIETKKWTIKVGQYLKPERLDDSSEILYKLFFFMVQDIVTDKYFCSYHLEFNTWDSSHYLGVTSRQGHAQVIYYGEEIPTYWRIRSDVLRDLLRRKRA